MRQTIIVSALTAVITVVLSVFALNQLRAGTVSSASTQNMSASANLPSSEDGQIQGDTDCDDDVDAVDALGVLINVAALEALGQQEPCTDIANLIIRPHIYDRFRPAARHGVIILARGKVERQGKVIHVLVNCLESLEWPVGALQTSSRDFH